MTSGYDSSNTVWGMRALASAFMSGEQAQASALPENSGTQAWRALTSAGDSGAGATAGPFKSQIGGIGPQSDFCFPSAKCRASQFRNGKYQETEAVGKPR